MRLSVAIGLTAAAVAFAVAGLVATGGSDARDKQVQQPTTGPVIALYVVDHLGAQPSSPAGLRPYRQAFRRVLAGCWINAEALSSLVFQLSDQASMGSGTEIDNLAVLQGLVRHVGPTRADCTQRFQLAEARLEGASLDALGG
jgi:hypothetical protein